MARNSNLVVMPFDFKSKLVICITSTALFDCRESHEIFLTQGVPAYQAYQQQHVDVPLSPGVGFPLVKALLQLNSVLPADDPTKFVPLVEVVIVSRNDARSGNRVRRSIRHWGLPITRFSFTGGTSVTRYLPNFSCDLFLSTEDDQVREALLSRSEVFDGIAAGLVKGTIPGDVLIELKTLPTHSALTTEQLVSAADQVASSSASPVKTTWPSGQVRIAFDGDGVLFSDEAENVFQQFGIEAFQKHERDNQEIALPPGPMKRFALKLQYVRQQLPAKENWRIRTFLVTARNDEATERAINTLEQWGLYMDEAHFLGGADKTPMLKTINPAIFFDDGQDHIDRAASHVPSAHIPYGRRNDIVAPTIIAVPPIDSSPVN